MPRLLFLIRRPYTTSRRLFKRDVMASFMLYGTWEALVRCSEVKGWFPQAILGFPAGWSKAAVLGPPFTVRFVFVFFAKHAGRGASPRAATATAAFVAAATNAPDHTRNGFCVAQSDEGGGTGHRVRQARRSGGRKHPQEHRCQTFLGGMVMMMRSEHVVRIGGGVHFSCRPWLIVFGFGRGLCLQIVHPAQLDGPP